MNWNTTETHHKCEVNKARVEDHQREPQHQTYQRMNVANILGTEEGMSVQWGGRTMGVGVGEGEGGGKKCEVGHCIMDYHSWNSPDSRWREHEDGGRWGCIRQNAVGWSAAPEPSHWEHLDLTTVLCWTTHMHTHACTHAQVHIHTMLPFFASGQPHTKI